MSDIGECCSVCFRRVGISTGDDGMPPVDLGRCALPGGFECRAVGQAVAEYRRENEVLRSNSDHLSSENAALSRQVDSMAMRIESLAQELAKPEDVRLREVLDALEGRAVIFDGLGARVGHLLDEMDEWIGRAGEAERLAEERLAHANQLQADIEAEMQGRQRMGTKKLTTEERNKLVDEVLADCPRRLHDAHGNLRVVVEWAILDGSITAAGPEAVTVVCAAVEEAEREWQLAQEES